MPYFEVQTAIGRRGVGDGQPVFLIAEVGKNFIQSEEGREVEDYVANAIALAKAAKEAGADAVKFQTHVLEDEQADIDVTAPHFKGLDRYRWVKRNQEATPLEGFWKPLKRACDELGIVFFSTPMSRAAAHKLAAVEPALWKVGSGDLLDFVLLDYLRRSGKPIIISSGMSTLEEVDEAMAFLKEKTDKLALLHCVSRYPCPPEDLNLRTVPFLAKRYGVATGFSDHSITIESSIAAVALGATVIEKHFSFGRDLWGSDHKVSLLPAEMADLAVGIRRIQSDPEYRRSILDGETVKRAMGTEDKILEEDEAVFRPLFRKTLCAAQDLPAGTIIEPEHLYAMRPQAHLAGLPSEAYPHVLGRTLKRSVQRKTPITEEDFGPSGA